jgi:hypothetical protein
MDLPTVSDLLILAGTSIAAGIVVFAIVFLMTLCYSWMEKKNPKTPKILLMLFCTIIGAFIAELLALAAIYDAVSLGGTAAIVALLAFPVVAALIAFPIVFFMAYYFETLEKKNPKTPRILHLLWCSIVGTLIAEIFIYTYMKYKFLPVAVPNA